METETRTPLDTFADTLRSHEDDARTFHKSWKGSSVLSNNELTCAACSATKSPSLDPRLGVSLLVPLTVGGSDTADNRIVLCRSCATARGSFDITDPAFTCRLSAPLPADVLAKRSLALISGENHLTSLWPCVPLDRLTGVLEKRYENPRFRVHAHGSREGCFIGFRRRPGEPQAYSGASALLRHQYKAIVEERDGHVLFTLTPKHFLSAVWALIDLNGLVVALPLGRTQCSWEWYDTYDWRRCWTERYTRLGDVRRRYRTRQERQPWPAKELSQNPIAVRSRNRKSKTEPRKRMWELERERGQKLLEQVNQWYDMQSPAYRFRPTKAMREQAWLEANYLTWTLEKRREYRQANPSFKPPRL